MSARCRLPFTWGRFLLMLILLNSGLAALAAPSSTVAVSCSIQAGKAVINEVNTNSDFIEIYLLQAANVKNWELFVDASRVKIIGTGSCAINGTSTKDNQSTGATTTSWPAGTFISCDTSMNPSNNEVLLADRDITYSGSPGAVTIDYLSYGTPSPSAKWSVPSACATLFPGHSASNKDIARLPDGSGSLGDNGNAITKGTPNTPLPVVSVGDAAVAEGDFATSTMTFPVTLSKPASVPVTLNYATSNDTATGGATCGGGSDYISTSGTLTVAAGRTTGSIAVTVCGDTTTENDETFSLTLTSPSNATLGTAVATGTILNDDVATSQCLTQYTFTGSNNTAPGSDWITTSSNGSFGLPRIFNNRLRLTDASGDAASAVQLQKKFPGAGNKIVVEFDYYGYAGSGADGIALAFSDAVIAPQAGAYGGSLGYAQKTGINGFAGGWLGVGFDEYGNFSSAGEGRSGGSGAMADSVTVRGSGSGTTGYAFHSTSGALSPGIDQPGSTAGPGHRYRITIDHSDSIHGYVWVERSTDGGTTYTLVIPRYDAKAKSGQAAVPTDWRLSLTGSTGGANNIHEIDNLNICAALPIDAIGPNHYQISHSGTALTCEAEPVTISAHDSVHGRVGAAGKTLSLSTGSSRGSWSASADSCTQTCFNAAGAAVACAGTFTATPTSGALANKGQASYLFATGETGVRLCFKHDATGSVNINATDGAATESSGSAATEVTPGTDPSLVFSNTGLRFYANGSVDTLGNLLAGLGSNVSNAIYQPSPQTLTIRALKSSETTPARCVPLLGSATKTIQFAYQCIDPAACHTASAGLEVNGTAVTGSASVPTPASNVSVAFDASGYGAINLKYWDVGQIKLYASGSVADSGTGGAVAISTGASNAFVVKPYGFSVMACTGAAPCTAANSYAATDGSGTVFGVAGVAFNATVKALAFGGTVVTPSFGLGAGSGTESVLLSPTLVLPSGGATGALSGTSSILRSSFSNGIASVTDLKWSEVGVMTLTASNAAFEGVTLAPAAVGTSGPIGRFKPDHFAISTPVLTPSCSSGVPFTYFGQDGFTTKFTLTAQSASNLTTSNYAGSGSSADWAKLPLTMWGGAPASAGSPGFGFTVSAWAPSQPAGSSLASSATSPTTSNSNTWIAGTTTVTAKHQVARPAAVAAPSTVTVTALPVDSDGVSATSATTIGSPLLRFGRLRLQNAFGSEKLPLAVPLQAQYWTGNFFENNTDDSCTGVSVPATVTLTGSETLATKVASLQPDISRLYFYPLVAGKNELPPQTPTVNSATLNAGRASLQFPKSDKRGWLDIILQVPPYLLGNWGNCNGQSGVPGLLDDLPCARATFGIFGAKSPIIYRRENY